MKLRQRFLLAGIFAMALSTSVCDYLRNQQVTLVHCPDLTPAECRQKQDIADEVTRGR